VDEYSRRLAGALQDKLLKAVDQGEAPADEADAKK